MGYARFYVSCLNGFAVSMPSAFLSLTSLRATCAEHSRSTPFYGFAVSVETLYGTSLHQFLVFFCLRVLRSNCLAV